MPTMVNDAPPEASSADDIPERVPTRTESQPVPPDLSESTARSTQSLPIRKTLSDNNVAGPASPTSAIPPRKSYQLKRTLPRQSEEFDRRFDGPFGRPSLVMQRRQSSVYREHMGLASPGSRPEGQPAPDLEKAEGGHGEGRSAQDRAASIAGHVGAPIFLPEPPPLNYTLKTRYWSIFFFWSLILFDSVVCPIALYFGLWYGVGPGTDPGDRKLSPNAIFSIVTAAVGGASIVEYILRFWRLWKKNSTCRVIGARRWYLDAFHWNFSLGWIIVMVELIVGTVPEFPPIRLLSMPVVTMLFVLATELLVVDMMRLFHLPAPFRISSVPEGAQLRPGIYSVIEDVVAVDGSGGTEFRTALDKRYSSSHTFRSMLRRLGLFWGIGGEACAVVCTILIFTINAEAGYVIGWAVPFIWGGVWALVTIWYVKRMLKIEQKEWNEEVEAVGTRPSGTNPVLMQERP